MNLSKQPAIRTAHWFPRCFKCNEVMYVKDTDTPMSEKCWRGLNMECNSCCEEKLEERRIHNG